jgi:phosphoribosylanthranilate isomerase
MSESAKQRMANRRLQIKICGLTTLEDALIAAQAGADLLGFIFFEKSPRYVSPATVRDIVQQIKGELPNYELRISKGELRFVGVFVNTPADQVAAVLDACELDLAQLHGEEDERYFAALPGRAFKALRPCNEAEAAAEAARFAPLGPAAGPSLLLDAYHPSLRGGTGTTADWSLAAGLASSHRLLLAGGLRPENVAQAVRQVRPWGVDVSGGVEAGPGRKDHDLVWAFVARARTAAAELSGEVPAGASPEERTGGPADR